MSILKRGLKGAPVKRLQAKLGVTADGDFGPGTEKALKEWQAANGLAADGIAGPDTFAAIGLPELILLRKGSRGAQVKKLQEGLGIGADGIFGAGTAKSVAEFQAKSGLEADGMAGPTTLSKLTTFADVVTEKVVEMAAVQPDEEHFEAEPLPELDGVEVVASAEAEKAEPPKSAWGKVKGWFS
ncbi:peptidoglycan hydrolase-like protein with peptidoglycan-binding domain [Yoonia maritima]|uniref:Peptidoglycan hydrolase-like protein with peptidoglycan-binding domain n=1 Tax=Yoonia maritima TaxID=1435347 RepID=A0A2T0VWK9_9RHOB|nr:peptidoglycan-binding protein [Yoonia maritima]PRY76273.1 peptidoglycan hydrolase-like protein with peptidoglycan-binding domain [Yoonia maritima]